MSVVIFDPIAFLAQYPQFSTVNQPVLSMYFAMAGDFVNNTDCSSVPDMPIQAGLRTRVLYLLTAHLAAIFSGVNGQPPTGLVGRISDATEGSVSVGTTVEIKAQSAQWFLQTPWGFAAWQALAPYRTALYVPKAPRNFGPFFIGPNIVENQGLN